MGSGGYEALSVVYLDTHVAVWLHDGLVEKLTAAATDAIEASALLLSPMVYLEFAYLYRRGRICVPAATLYANLNTSFGMSLCGQSFAAVSAMASEVEWTNDPFDRIIVAQAKCNGNSRLITADELIRSKYERALW